MSLEMNAACIEQLKSGDQYTWELVILEHQDRILNYLYHLEGHYEDALDLTQECFMRAWRGIKTFRSGEEFLPWLYAIARNVQIEKHRRKYHPQFSIEAASETGFEVAESRQSPLSRAEDNQTSERIRAALLHVPEEYRSALVLRFMDDLSYEEIAAIQGVAVGTAKSRVFRGKEALAEVLGEQAKNGTGVMVE
jgi:RNA polymerase sigma-70 factor, ECF subfamily